jgi:formate/nitrite transporter FocA (FNT family)
MDPQAAPKREVDADDVDRGEREIERDPGAENVPGAFERAIDEGRARNERTWPALCSTGIVGGLDVGVGVLALLVVRARTDNELLGALAFPVGFLALTLGNSELFTENFLVPVAALVAKRATFAQLIRLWVITLAANLAGGWVVAWLIANALPDVRVAALAAASSYHVAGIGAASFASAVLGGMVITLLTWLQHSTNSVPAKVVAAFAFAFVLAAPPLAHSIVGSLEQFVALIQGAPFGYADWLGFLGWVVLGNTLGGVGLVTALRLVQVGREKIEFEQPDPST